MKRIIDGQTYNTETARVAARYIYEDELGGRAEAVIYQTAGKAFFAVHRKTDEPDGQPIFEALTLDQLQKLVSSQDNFEIVDENAIESPPEAVASESASAIVYARIPAALKRQAEVAAADKSMMFDDWLLGRIEHGVHANYQDTTQAKHELLLSTIWGIAATVRIFDRQDDGWDRAKCLAALEAIAETAETLGNSLFESDSWETRYEEEGDRELRRRFQPYD